MLNGDAHHSLVWEAEPRIWPLLIVKDGCNPKREDANRTQKNSIGPQIFENLWPNGPNGQ